MRVQLYGMIKHRDLFTRRQLVAMTTLSDLVSEARKCVRKDSIVATLADDTILLNNGGKGATAYAEVVGTYLGLGVSKLADYNCTIVTWSQSRDQAGHAFTKQALPMVWDYAEVNPFARAAGDLTVSLGGITEAIEKSLPASLIGYSQQLDATASINGITHSLVSTDSLTLIMSGMPIYQISFMSGFGKA